MRKKDWSEIQGDLRGKYTVVELSKKLGISKTTYYRRKKNEDLETFKALKKIAKKEKIRVTIPEDSTVQYGISLRFKVWKYKKLAEGERIKYVEYRKLPRKNYQVIIQLYIKRKNSTISEIINVSFVSFNNTELSHDEQIKEILEQAHDLIKTYLNHYEKIEKVLMYFHELKPIK